MKFNYLICFLLISGMINCQPEANSKSPEYSRLADTAQKPATVESTRVNAPLMENSPATTPGTTTTDINYDSLYKLLPDSAMVELVKWDNTILLDIRYATTNNFTGKVLYDCGKCYLRKKVARDLIAAHTAFKKKGYRIKVFDGYRPQSVQWKLWNTVPDKNYVSDPRKGSMHNRGCAVDLTIVDASGNEIDMGTPYDFFGPEAHTYNTKLPAQVQANRKMLREVMDKSGFNAITTEWWHFAYRKKLFNLADIPVCEVK